MRVDKYYVCRADSFVVRYMQGINKVSVPNDSSLSLLLNCEKLSAQSNGLCSVEIYRFPCGFSCT